MTLALSILVPCRNEQSFIEACLDSILANDYPFESCEILVIDGMSTDRTRELLEPYLRRSRAIRLLDNPKQSAPAALNIGLAVAEGEIIMRMDAHTVYPTTYISSLVDWLKETGADNVGGRCIARPVDGTSLARAIAIGLSHPFGVGNAYFRIGTDRPKWVDTVPFGCYPRRVFDEIGDFDEELVRNQDDELNHRLITHGGRILLVPDVVCDYYPRRSLRELFRMYFGYGYFKPLVARKVGRLVTLRQLVPSIFLISIVVTACFAPWLWLARVGLATIVVTYTVANLLAALPQILKSPKVALSLIAVFPTIHVSYGVGFLKGILDFIVLKRTYEAESRMKIVAGTQPEVAGKR